MQANGLFLGPRGPNSSQLGFFPAGAEAPLLLLCKTRKHCKNEGLGLFFVLLGLSSSPTPSKKGASQPDPFSPQAANLDAMEAWLGHFLLDILQFILWQIGFESPL